MRQLYSERQNVPVASPSFITRPKEKKFCGYCKKNNHSEQDCWKKGKAQKDHSVVFGNQSADVPTFVSFVTSGDEVLSRSGLID
jgi:predicted amidophosphoribosyltransferase